MKFIERKKRNRILFWKHFYTYELLDVFGKIEYRSPKKLSPNQLDMLTVAVMRAGAGKGVANKIRYEFIPKPLWEEDDEQIGNELPSSEGGESRPPDSGEAR